MLHHAYIALGSNIASPWGSPAETINAAVLALGALGELARVSPMYLTAPVGKQLQPTFVNAALCLLTEIPPQDLMNRLLDVERAFGRDRPATMLKGPRTLDLDLLLYDEIILASPHLTLPHPELAARRFVLEPLAQIAPGLRHPLHHKTISELLAALPESGPNGIDAVERMHE